MYIIIISGIGRLYQNTRNFLWYIQNIMYCGYETGLLSPGPGYVMMQARDMFKSSLNKSSWIWEP